MVFLQQSSANIRHGNSNLPDGLDPFFITIGFSALFDVSRNFDPVSASDMS